MCSSQIFRRLHLQEKRVEKEELRFPTTRLGSSVISRIEEVGKTKKFNVKKSKSCVRQQNGWKGKLDIDVGTFVVTPAFMVVEVKKSSSDTLKFYQYCSTELRPTLKDIEWMSTIPA